MPDPKAFDLTGRPKIRPIKGWEKYKISTKGTVWSKCSGKWRKRKIMTEKKKGYKYVILYNKFRKPKHYLIHRLVLETFVGPCPKGQVARHFPDPDPSNNKLENLQWGTCQENSQDRKYHETEFFKYGEKHPYAKLTIKKVRKIRRLFKTGRFSKASLARYFQISESNIRFIIQGKTWVGV